MYVNYKARSSSVYSYKAHNKLHGVAGAECLSAFRLQKGLLGPQERQAVNAWCEANGPAPALECGNVQLELQLEPAGGQMDFAEEQTEFVEDQAMETCGAHGEQEVGACVGPVEAKSMQELCIGMDFNALHVPFDPFAVSQQCSPSSTPRQQCSPSSTP